MNQCSLNITLLVLKNIYKKCSELKKCLALEHWQTKIAILLFSDWQKAFVKMAEFKGIKPTEYDPKPEDSESTGSGLSIMIL